MFRSVAILILSVSTFTAQAALLGRAPVTPGGMDYQAYYDDALGITWLADANLAATNRFGLPANYNEFPGPGGLSPLGKSDPYTAQAWIAGMNAASYLGAGNWRLPRLIDAGNDGCVPAAGTDCGFSVDLATGEMAHLYYSTLGNTPALVNGGVQPCYMAGPLFCLANSSPFANLQPARYWYDAVSVVNPDSQWWLLNFATGEQTPFQISLDPHVWAVHDGDPFAVVPIPPAAWLFGSALGVMGRLIRRHI